MIVLMVIGAEAAMMFRLLTIVMTTEEVVEVLIDGKYFYVFSILKVTK